MSQVERIYRIDDLLTRYKVVSKATFLGKLEVSDSTLKRDLALFRDRLNAPLVWDRELQGYRYESKEGEKAFELPGLWFNATEIHALLTVQHLLHNLAPELLAPHIKPLMMRLKSLLDEHFPFDALSRIRVHLPQARPYESEHFKPIATAVLQRKRLQIEHYGRFDNKHTKREISPQRLNYYRENWYVDAFCHLRNKVRSFSLDAIKSVKTLDTKAKEISFNRLAKELDSGYGIFKGKKIEWAQLVFTPKRAQWISKETWHPDQKGKWDKTDGSYHLSVPYSDPREISSDILRHIPEVKVKGPKSLQTTIKKLMLEGIKNF